MYVQADFPHILSDYMLENTKVSKEKFLLHLYVSDDDDYYYISLDDDRNSLVSHSEFEWHNKN